MTKPLIHLNGSGRTYLTNSYSDAAQAVDAAMEALRVVYPHARDYYPLGTEALSLALEEHKQRLTQLRTIREELRELAEHCADAK